MLLILLPGLLWAQTESKLGSMLTVKQTETVTQPAGTIDRVSKRTLNSLAFEKDSIGSGQFQTVISPGAPLCWDSAGKKVKIDLSEKQAKTKGFQKAVQIGPSFIEYDSLCNLHYEKGGLSFEVKPLFKGVKAVFEPLPTMIKATYFLEKDGPDSLAWTLTDPHGLAERKIPAFTARDAAGKAVALIETRTAGSLSVRLKSVEGVSWPVAIDPTIQDTSDVYATNSRYFDISNATWATAHDITSSTANALAAGLQAGAWYSGGNYAIRRSALLWPLTGISGATVDSAYFYSSIQAGYPADDSVRVVFVEGTFSGAPADGWVNDYSTTEWTERAKVLEGAGEAYTVANAAGRAAILAALGDTLRTFMLEANHDLLDSAPAAGSAYGFLYYGPAGIKLVVFTSTGNPPGVTTVTDSLRASAVLFGTIDSTGGVNCTARGFQWWIDGDTTTITKSGSFGTGAYQDTTDEALPLNIYVKYRSFATNVNSTTYGAVDSFLTTGGGGSASLIFDGRTVDTWIRR